MKSVSIKNFSLLGLVLMAASAVTAAVLPGKSDDKRVVNGTRIDRSNDAGGGLGIISCTAATGAVSCTATANSDTTAAGTQTTETIGGFKYQTVGNTSALDGVNGDVSSVLGAA